MLNTDDIAEAVAELRRSHDLGLSGGLIPTAATPDRPYDSPAYDPLWEAATELPLSLHLGAELGWIPFFLERMDYTYTQRHGNVSEADKTKILWQNVAGLYGFVAPPA